MSVTCAAAELCQLDTAQHCAKGPRLVQARSLGKCGVLSVSCCRPLYSDVCLLMSAASTRHAYQLIAAGRLLLPKDKC